MQSLEECTERLQEKFLDLNLDHDLNLFGLTRATTPLVK
jgi:hypothetical protein